MLKEIQIEVLGGVSGGGGVSAVGNKIYRKSTIIVENYNLNF